MRLLLNEIKVMDAYERYYSNVPSYLWEEIVGRLQRDRNGNYVDTLLPETKWVLKLYKDKSPRLVEDLYKLKNNNGDGYLDIFLRAKERRMLTGIQGDLFKYKSIAALGEFVSTLDVEEILGRTKGEQSSDVNSAATDIEIPYEDDEWKVIIPKSYDASCYWGNGTRWCTATREDDRWYETYSSQGPLYILIDKQTKEKYQFHFESEQYMDKMDREIDFPFADEIPNWNNGLSDFFIKVMEKSGSDAYVTQAEYYITGYQNGRKLIRTGLDELNYIKREDGELLLDKGFEKAWDFTKYGFAKIGSRGNGNKNKIYYNFIDTNGKLLSEMWFDAVEQFRTPYASVWIWGDRNDYMEQCNLIDTNGDLLFDTWFDDIRTINHKLNLIVAKKDGKFACFKFDGTMWNENWFDNVDYDPFLVDYVGYDDNDDKPTKIGVTKKNESKSYSMKELSYMFENIMKNLKK